MYAAMLVKIKHLKFESINGTRLAIVMKAVSFKIPFLVRILYLYLLKNLFIYLFINFIFSPRELINNTVMSIRQ